MPQILMITQNYISIIGLFWNRRNWSIRRYIPVYITLYHYIYYFISLYILLYITIYITLYHYIYYFICLYIYYFISLYILLYIPIYITLYPYIYYFNKAHAREDYLVVAGNKPYLCCTSPSNLNFKGVKNTLFISSHPFNGIYFIDEETNIMSFKMVRAK